MHAYARATAVKPTDSEPEAPADPRVTSTPSAAGASDRGLDTTKARWEFALLPGLYSILGLARRTEMPTMIQLSFALPEPTTNHLEELLAEERERETSAPTTGCC